MRWATIRLVLALGAGALITTAAFRFGVQPSRAEFFKPPAWIGASEQYALKYTFHAPKPLRTYFIAYPRKVAVVWVFPKPVGCFACPGEPGGTNIVRTSFSRISHTMLGSIHFCLALADCLRR